MLMIRFENFPEFAFLCKFMDFPIDKFIWSNLIDQSNAKVGWKMSDDWSVICICTRES